MARYNNDERNAEIIRRRLAGEWPSDIRRVMGISRNVVAGVLDRAGLGDPNVDRSVPQYSNACRGEAHGKAKLSERAVMDIRESLTIGRPYHPGNARDLAAKYEVNVATVLAVGRRRLWAHVA